MERYILAILILFSFTIIEVKPQEKLHKTIPELTMPNPETAGLGRYGNIPINHYTGTANIAVPLYTINFDGLEIPINLSYNTGGIKIDQEATWVGLGWTLSCEPVITRQIKGLCDITGGEGGATRGYIYTDIPLPNYNSQTEELIERLKIYYYPFAHSCGWDTEPDIFTANIFGESISFILTQKALSNGVIDVKMINGDKGYKVEYIEKEKSFIISNSAGYKFFFSNIERSITALQNGTNGYAVTSSYKDPLITGWKLNKIVSPNEKKLEFTYENIVTQSQPIKSNTKKRIVCGYRPTAWPGDDPNNIIGYTSYVNGYGISYLKSISSDDIKIEFKSSERLDLGSEKEYITNISNYIGFTSKRPQRLNNIIIKNSLNDTIYNFSFNYSYFNENKINEEYPEKYLRLKLNSIYNHNLLYREFSYINSDVLSEKTSMNSDFWGFYNGSNNYSKGFPSLFKEYSCTYQNRLYIEGGNRFPNINFSQNGLLETIIYPTGGYTKFNYESNEINLNNTNVEKFEIYNYPLSLKEYSLQSDSEDYPKASEFEITEISEANAIVEVTYGCGSEFEGSFTSRHVKYTIDSRDAENIAYQIINVENNSIVTEGKYTSIASGPPTNLNSREGWNKRVLRIKLNKGKYKILVRGLKHISNFYDEEEFCYPGQTDYGKTYNFRVRLKVRIPMLSFCKNINAPVGGVRIESIEDYDNNMVKEKKEYKYTNENNGEEISSGILMNDLKFDNIRRYMFYQQSDYSFSYENVAEVYSNSIYNSPAQNHIGYSRVEEIYTNGKDNNGKKILEFINKPNKYENKIENSGQVVTTCIGQAGAPFGAFCPTTTSEEIAAIPSHSYQDINGKLLRETYFNNNGNKVRESIFNYNRDNHDVLNIVHPQAISTGILQYQTKHYGIETSSICALQIYRIISENIILLSRTDTEYNNGIPISKTVTYEYNDKYFPKKITETTSLPNKNSEIEYKYPFDLVNTEQTSLLQKLINNNRINEPVIIKTKTGGNQTSESHLKYREETVVYKENNQNLTSNIIVKDEVHQLFGEGSIAVESLDKTHMKVKYDKYNSSGKLVQYTGLDGVPVSYLWSYNGQYPIAEIKNATYEQVKSIINEATLTTISNKNEPAASDWTMINNLRLNSTMTNAHITTFKYKPLVGILETTDPSWLTTYYDYDGFGRLKETYIYEDNTKKIIRKYDYNYRNQ